MQSRVLDDLRAAVRALTHADEEVVTARLLESISLDAAARRRITERTQTLVTAVRAGRSRTGTLDAFLQEFGLSSQEGVALMCLAESLLRVPDERTADRLIREKISAGRWTEHLGHSDSLFVNASAWGLMLTGRLIEMEADVRRDAGAWLRRLAGRSGEPLVRRALIQAMRFLGSQFVMGRTIGEALGRADSASRYSYDMLGEGARTAADAARYAETYARAIEVVGRSAAGDPIRAPGISIKLSALHPRYEFAQKDRVMAELLPVVHDLLHRARQRSLNVTLDAEEADRLDLSLDLFEALARDPELADWPGLGIAVQAYQKRAPAVIDWLAELARQTRRRLLLRLVKGAYWDTEIKHAQITGVDDYPVFTRKTGTDLCYLVCAERMLAHTGCIFPQFATHNAHTVCAILEMTGDHGDFEFQRLHGMGELLYAQVAATTGRDVPCRVYAPVGAHRELLAYLMRRLLENGANTSFVHRVQSERVPVEEIAADPIGEMRALSTRRHPGIPAPRAITAPERLTAKGIDLADPLAASALLERMQTAWHEPWRAAPVIGGEAHAGDEVTLYDPANRRRAIGTVVWADAGAIDEAFERAARCQPEWDRLGGERRAAILETAAERLEAAAPELMAIAVREGGKTIPDALAEVREAVDFCRYYAAGARHSFAGAQRLPAPAAECNELSLHGRGVFVSISPWNFPAAIFTGQLTAALAAGNAVVAKPAEQTPLMAAAVTRHLLDAGVPAEVLHLLPGDGETIGAALLRHPHTAGVAFTGSTETARAIQGVLADRPGPIVPLIAETGGQNVMFVDSTALLEQVTDDVIASAFLSTGQRCSALRCLLVQEDVADELIDMVRGAARQLRVGDPAELRTDLGPVIDAPSLASLQRHCQRMEKLAAPIHAWQAGPVHNHGHFLGPHIYEIDSLRRLEGEVFGPVLHVLRYPASALDEIIEEVRCTGYGLTLGVHSRIESTARYIFERLGIGNTYVNRSMVGAAVGMQPFGGQGLSGTGPKAGGPHYLQRFATEKVLTLNTLPFGGGAALFNLEEK